MMTQADEQFDIPVSFSRVDRKKQKSVEPQRHQGTKEAFFCLPGVQARKKLCVSVSLWFPSFQGLLRQPRNCCSGVRATCEANAQRSDNKEATIESAVIMYMDCAGSTGGESDGYARQMGSVQSLYAMTAD